MSALNFIIILLCVIVSSLCIALKLLIADFREVRIKVLKLETFIEADNFAEEFVNGLKDLHIDANRKTENSSEKPNNWEDLQDWKDRMWAEAIVTEPTISKMEQVDKDINVRSKDEPQLTPNYCGTCKHREVSCGDLPCDVCHGYSNYEPKDEPQTDGNDYRV